MNKPTQPDKRKGTNGEGYYIQHRHTFEAVEVKALSKIIDGKVLIICRTCGEIKPEILNL